jgi:DNA adenine methylase
MSDNQSQIRPFLHWAGGKRQLLGEIEKYLPPSWSECRYFEPFLGGGAVLFAQRPSRAVINDRNRELMLTYLVVRDQVEELIELLTVYQSRHSRSYFLQVRAWDREPGFTDLPPLIRAARFIYLNKTCYNGLYRVNSHGYFNTSFGRGVAPLICDGEALREAAEYLRENKLEILQGDFAQAVKTADLRSFVYFDPPYHGAKNKSFTSYQADKFDEVDQIRLRDVALELTKRGVRCLISNADTPFIRQLYAGESFEAIGVLAKRSINSDPHKRGKIQELLLKNWR